MVRSSGPGHATDVAGMIADDDEVGRRRLAETFAAELGSHSVEDWPARASGAGLAVTGWIDDEPALAEAVNAVGGYLRAGGSSVDLLPRVDIWSRRGVAGHVVCAHGESWSLAARSGGPFLILIGDRVWRVDGDPTWRGELAGIVDDLVRHATLL
ncbi:MAG: hypothetical protein HOV79_13620 [Hamadaea sp.]|nr:hypothetical protein [Hamadaea sp.]